MDVLLGLTRPQLYIGLYALDGALRENGPSDSQDYYWAFIVAPEDGTKEQQCVRYCIRKGEGREKSDPGKVEFDKVTWECDRSVVPLGRHDDIIARVLIAQVGDRKGMDEHIQLAWPEQTMHVKNSGRARTSKDWVQKVHEGLGGLSYGSLSGTRYMVSGKLADWKTIETCCTSFAQRVVKSLNPDTVPTFDMLKNREVL